MYQLKPCTKVHSFELASCNNKIETPLPMKATADNRKIETTDVLVVGGGLTGLAAAVVSATAGAETTLLEQAAVLGGNVTQAYVYSFCGLY